MWLPAFQPFCAKTKAIAFVIWIDCERLAALEREIGCDQQVAVRVLDRRTR